MTSRTDPDWVAYDEWQPGPREARRRLTALSPALRSRVGRALMDSRHAVEDPTLAAAVVAMGMRSKARYRHTDNWGLAVLLAAAFIGISFVPEIPWWVALGAVPAGVLGHWAWKLHPKSGPPPMTIEQHRRILASIGQVPPPGPVDAPEMVAQERRTVVAGSLVVLLLGLAAAIPAGLQIAEYERTAEELAARGVETMGVVMDFDRTGLPPDLILVRYSADGEATTAWVHEPGAIARGATLSLVYDPDNPSFVRPAEQLAGHQAALWWAGLFSGAMAAWAAVMLLRSVSWPTW